MIDWIEHDGGPQPVADDVWVRAEHDRESLGSRGHPAGAFLWYTVLRYHVLNQHLIDAARLEGIRLGLEAAAIVAGSRIGYPKGVEMRAAIRALDPETIAKEADQ